MSGKKMGCQTIGCTVCSCAHHDEGADMCKLDSIRVEPMQGCHTGKACDESLCASYRAK